MNIPNQNPYSDATQAQLARYRTAPINPAYYMVGNKDPEKPAAYIAHDQGLHTLTYSALVEESSRWAGYLHELGVRTGTRVAGLLPKRKELLGVVLGVWRLGAVYVPLFTAFGREAVQYRLKHSGTQVVLTDSANLAKLPQDSTTVVINVDEAVPPPRHEFDDWTPTTPDHPMILLYTSGTTGHPKGVVVPVQALATFDAYMRWGLDLKDGDRFWNLADPGWATGCTSASSALGFWVKPTIGMLIPLHRTPSSILSANGRLPTLPPLPPHIVPSALKGSDSAHTPGAQQRWRAP